MANPKAPSTPATAPASPKESKSRLGRDSQKGLLSSLNPFNAMITTSDLMLFTKYFAILTKAGIPVIKCLRILSFQIPKLKFRQKIVQMRNDVEGGVPLNLAFQKNDDIFNEIYVSLIRTGEESGRLFYVLERLAELLGRQLALRRRVQTALFYPVFVSLVAFVVVSFLMTFVIPKFATLFKQFGQDLPLPTQWVIWFSDFFSNNFLSIIALLMVLFIFYWEGQKRPAIKKYIDAFRLKLPVFGDLILKFNVSSFTRNIAILFQSGVSIINSMKLSLRAIDNLVLRSDIQAVIREVEGGSPIAVALSKADVMPELSLNMIDIGEESGTLDEMLERVAAFYEDEINYTVDSITAMIEPALMITLGVIVGGIVIAMYLPIFKMAKVVTGSRSS